MSYNFHIYRSSAGSGKTYTLALSFISLALKGDRFGFEDYYRKILAITFTNKAAREMKKRIADIVGSSEAKNLWMGTFHSVFAKILRFEADRLGYPSNFTIYDTQDSERLIRDIVKQMRLDKDVYKYKQVRSRISSFKNSLITEYVGESLLSVTSPRNPNPKIAIFLFFGIFLFFLRILIDSFTHFLGI